MTQAHEVGQDVVIRPFADFLREVNGGRSHNELSEVLHRLIAAARDTNKTAELVYRIKIEPTKKLGGEAFMISDEIKQKVPEFERGASLFYPNADGNLQRDDPRQMRFDSLEVISGRQEVVDPETGEIKTIGER